MSEKSLGIVLRNLVMSVMDWEKTAEKFAAEVLKRNPPLNVDLDPKTVEVWLASAWPVNVFENALANTAVKNFAAFLRKNAKPVESPLNVDLSDATVDAMIREEQQKYGVVVGFGTATYMVCANVIGRIRAAAKPQKTIQSAPVRTPAGNVLADAVRLFFVASGYWCGDQTIAPLAKALHDYDVAKPHDPAPAEEELERVKADYDEYKLAAETDIRKLDAELQAERQKQADVLAGLEKLDEAFPKEAPAHIQIYANGSGAVRSFVASASSSRICFPSTTDYLSAAKAAIESLLPKEPTAEEAIRRLKETSASRAISIEEESRLWKIVEAALNPIGRQQSTGPVKEKP